MVEIEQKTWVPRDGVKTGSLDDWPFERLTPAKRLDDNSRGAISGESFFIPRSSRADYLLMRANMLLKPFVFIRRSESQKIDGKPVNGYRVWKLRPEDAPRNFTDKRKRQRYQQAPEPVSEEQAVSQVESVLSRFSGAQPDAPKPHRYIRRSVLRALALRGS